MFADSHKNNKNNKISSKFNLLNKQNLLTLDFYYHTHSERQIFVSNQQQINKNLRLPRQQQHALA